MGGGVKVFKAVELAVEGGSCVAVLGVFGFGYGGEITGERLVDCLRVVYVRWCGVIFASRRMRAGIE